MRRPFEHGGGWDCGPGGHFSMHDGFAGVLHIIVPLLVLALLVVLFIWAVKKFTEANQARPLPATTPSSAGLDQAIAEVRMRYARGEIGREDFRAIAEDLGGSTHAG